MEDLRLIRSFVAVVANDNNFSAAARELALTPAAISKNIKKNKVNLKYGTFVYIINSKEKRNAK